MRAALPGPQHSASAMTCLMCGLTTPPHRSFVSNPPRGTIDDHEYTVAHEHPGDRGWYLPDQYADLDSRRTRTVQLQSVPHLGRRTDDIPLWPASTLSSRARGRQPRHAAAGAQVCRSLALRG